MEKIRSQFLDMNVAPEQVGILVIPNTRVGAEKEFERVLESQSYEDVSLALLKIENLQRFRQTLVKEPFGSFFGVFEEMTFISTYAKSNEEGEKSTQIFLGRVASKANNFSPRVADMYLAVLAELGGPTHELQFISNKKMIEKLRENGAFLDLIDTNISWNLKLNRIEKGLLPYLKTIRDRDKREGKEMEDDLREWREEELQKIPSTPPPSSSDSKPGVDPMERLQEGERAPSWWTIDPPWRAHYKEKSLSKWNNATNSWSEDLTYGDAEVTPLSGNLDHKKGLTDITLHGSVLMGVWNNVPTPYTHGLHKISAGNKKCIIRSDQNGNTSFMVEGEGIAEVDIALAPNPNKKFVSKNLEEIKIPKMHTVLSLKTENKLSEIEKTKRGNIMRAVAIRSYIMSTVKYLAPKTQEEAEEFNHYCNTHANGFAGAVDEAKKGDCDVANTYFVALCSRLGIPARHVVGHSVNSKAGIHSGTGHAWSEVWDDMGKEWTRIDATPPGDPNLEDEPPSGERQNLPGENFGGEAIAFSDEQLEEIIKKISEHKEKLSYTQEERTLAEATGIELKEARQIVKEINEAENTRLPNGEKVSDALSRLFNTIVESRKSVAVSYDGPVRKREGGERIENIVRHKIGMMSGETDPISREKPTEETKEEKIIGGFDLYFIGDKSGSMNNSSVDNEFLWQMQRRAAYLILSSMYHFERNAMRAGLQKESALSVRTQMVSFRGDKIEDIDADKPLSPQFSQQDKVKMWHSAGNRGGGNGDVTALNYVSSQIHNEIEEQKKKGFKDNRLRIVVACSDGGYVGAEAEMHALAEELGKTGTIVVGMGLTETANSVPLVMHNPPHSYGDMVKDINDLPTKVARHIVLQAVKLFPEKAQENAKRIIESSLAKFNNLK